MEAASWGDLPRRLELGARVATAKDLKVRIVPEKKEGDEDGQRND
jgi:hypothetical protein